MSVVQNRILLLWISWTVQPRILAVVFLGFIFRTNLVYFNFCSKFFHGSIKKWWCILQNTKKDENKRMDDKLTRWQYDYLVIIFHVVQSSVYVTTLFVGDCERFYVKIKHSLPFLNFQNPIFIVFSIIMPGKCQILFLRDSTEIVVQ